MKRIRKRKLKTWGKQMLSFMLITALLLGLIPESAYAASTTTTPALAEKSYTSGGCTITYKETSTWGNYVNAEITIQNDADYAKSLWEVEFAYQGMIGNIWNADIDSSEHNIYRIKAKNYNSTIDAGKSVSFGFTAYGAESKPEVPDEITYKGDGNENISMKTPVLQQRSRRVVPQRKRIVLETPQIVTRKVK